MSKVIIAFADLQDDGHIYNVGDEYPRAGVTVSEERLEELTSDRNRRGVALIADEEAKEGPSEATGDTEEPETGVNPPKITEAKGRPRKGQKKDA